MFFSFPFASGFGGGSPIVTDEECWAGTPSLFEARMVKPLPTYGLESLRLRFLYTVADNHAMEKAARATLQMAFETELSAIVAKFVTLGSDVMRSKICERRSFLSIDRDMAMMRFLVEPAMDELADVPQMPAPYVDLLRRYIASDYPRYRMCAMATSLCLATAVLVP